jgi:hypothetical protein
MKKTPDLKLRSIYVYNKHLYPKYTKLIQAKRKHTSHLAQTVIQIQGESK